MYKFVFVSLFHSALEANSALQSAFPQIYVLWIDLAISKMVQSLMNSLPILEVCPEPSAIDSQVSPQW